jgi:RNA-directed DNA polymerase
MTAAKLQELKSLDDLAEAAGVEREFIRSYVDSNTQSVYYNALKLSKRGKRRKGEFRTVYAAREERLGALHRAISMIVANSATFGDHVQGFRKKRSTRTNAKYHLAAKVLLHADIKGFFDAIVTAQVAAAFIKEGMPATMAQLTAKACTIDGLLKQGTRCSPIIANLVSLDMDSGFLRLAERTHCTYTRYADDLTFSGDIVPSEADVRTILESHGFKLRNDKCILQNRGRCQFVTGLSVADAVTPRLPLRLKRQLRLTMHYIEKYGIAGHLERRKPDSGHTVSWLEGMLKFAYSIEPKPAAAWLKIFNKARTEWNKSLRT